MAEDINLDMMEEDTDELSTTDKYLTFVLGDDEFGINISYVTEIIGMVPITFVPELPMFVKGIINLRGQMIPVIDVRLRFDKEPIPYNDRTCIIVIEIHELSIGFIVDSVAECDEIPPDRILPPPQAKSGFKQKYVSGIGRIGEKIVLLMDCEKLIDEDMNMNMPRALTA